MAKRLFSFMLVLALLVSLMPQVTVGVTAEGTKAPGMSEFADHTNHDGWTAWGDDEAEKGKFPSAAGNYYLVADLELTDQATVSYNIHLCLNDHTITQKTAGKRHIYLNEGKGIALSIYDCGTKGKITGGTGGTGTVINVTRTNTFNLYGGTITGNNKATDAVIYVQAAKSTYPVGGVFNMYGGEISGNEVSNGVVYSAGGATSYANSQVNIYGGAIKDNVVTGNGGAIYVKEYGSVNVDGGEISGNKAKYGAGIYADNGYVTIKNAQLLNNDATETGGAIYAKNSGTASFENVTISESNAKNAPAVYVQNKVQLSFKDTEITGNASTATQADGYGAAVYVTGATSKVTLSGNVTISGNTVKNAAIADLFINSSEGYDIEKLYVNEMTGGDVRFGIKDKAATITEASDVVLVEGTQSISFPTGSICYWDGTEEKTVGFDGTAFKFVTGHYHNGIQYLPWSETNKLPSKDSETNVGYYLENDVTVSKTANKSKVTTGTLHLCLNGKTVSQAMTDVTPSDSSSSDIFRVDGGALYMSDCTTVYDENGYFVSGGKITGGVKKGNGAALYINKAASVVEATGVEFSGNVNTETSEGYGGAAVMARYNTTAARFIGCKFDNNQSKNISTNALVGGAGAIALREGGSVYAEKCLFTNNKAKHGAAIFCTGSTLTVKDSKITGNTGDNAVAINILGTSNVTIDSCTITGNSNSSNDGYGAVNLANGASNVYLTGKTVIYDNLNKDGNQQNLHLQNYKDLDYDVSGLTAGSKVGVSFLNTRLESGDKFFSTTGMTSNPGYCISDHEGYEVVFNETSTRLELAEKSTEPEPSEPTEPTEPSEPPVVETHTHKLCNDASCTSHGADVEFQAWEKTDSLPTSGNWYLTENVTLTAATEISSELNLCLNGKTVTQTTNNRLYTINAGGVLSITDCGTTGTLTGGKHNTGSAIYVSNGTTFNLYAGKITNCGPKTTTSAQTGAPVFLHSANKGGATFNMYGGEITGNGGDMNWGGAVSNGGGNSGKTVYFNMYGGKIYGNTALNGGAIRVQTDAVVTIAGGEIYGNHATATGGAIYLNKAGVKLNLQGGKIYDNTAATNGGAIFVNSDAGQVTVSGAPSVQNNKVGTAQNNLHLAGNKKIVIDQLQTGANIGLSLDEARTQTQISTAALSSESVLAYFTSDNADLKPAQDADGYLILAAKVVLLPQVHKLCNDASCTEHADVTFEPWTSTTTLPTSGNWYLTEDVNVSAATSVSDDLNLCLNGHTITQTTANRIFSVSIDKTLSVTDCGTTGTITGGKNDFGSVTYLNEGATFNLFAGKLTGNGPKSTGASTGAVVFLRSAAKGGATFNMYGGEITGNGGENCWGGAASNGSGNAGKPVYVNMYGGKIYGNTALNGGAFRMMNDSQIAIYGGEIYNNTATVTGGAIYIADGAVLKLEDGKIYDNTAATNGGGIYANAAAGNITLVGATVVDNNKVGENQNNVYLAGKSMICAAGLTEGAKIGLTRGTDRTSDIVSTDKVSADQFAYFTNDNPVNAKLNQKDGFVAMSMITEHMHKICNDAACTDHAEPVAFMKWEKNDSLPLSGNYYLTADVQLSADYYDNYAISDELNLCLNGFTVTAYQGKRVMMVAKGGVLTITDCNENPGMLTGGTQTWGAGVNINAGGTFNLYGGKISGNKNLASSGGVGAIYVQGAGATFNMYGGEISGNESSSGAIYSPGNIAEPMYVNIYGGVIENNTSVKVLGSDGKAISTSGRGAAMYLSANTQLTISGGIIRNNTAEADGGAIMLTGKEAVMTMTGGEISGNKAANGGGLITLNYAKFIFEDGLFQGNEAVNGGGAIYISTSTTLEMKGGKVTGNKAKNGAGIYCYRSTATLDGGEVVENEATSRSGGIAFCGATAEINKITVKGNSAKEGGASYVNAASYTSGNETILQPSIVNINDGALITENKAQTNCGGLLIANDGVVVTMNGGEISKNSSANGGGIMTWKGATFILKGGKISGHNIKGNGGAMYISTASTFKMEGGTVSGNTAYSGGGIYVLRAKADFTGGSITGNRAIYKVTVNATTGKQSKSGGTAGAVYYSGATVNMSGTSMTYNTSESNGGAIVMGRASYTENGVKKQDNVTVNIYGGYYAYNESGSNAGFMLIQSKGTVVNMYGGTITGNKAKSNAGGIYVSTDTLFNMTGGTVTGNHAEGSGGAFYCYKSTANITGGNIHTNTATASAGMINAASKPCTVTIKNIKIYGNEAKSGGALVSQGKATMYVEDCEIYDNKSITGHGGAVFVSNKYSNGYFTNCKFYNNTSAGMGGAVYSSDFSDSSFTNCEFYDNHSGKSGGGLMLYVASTSTLENCVFRNNRTEGHGGGIAVLGDSVMKNILVENNTAAGGGGGVYTDKNSTTGSGIMKGLEMYDSQIKNNTAGAQGGGFYIYKGCRVELYNIEITGNKSTMEGGAIWAYEDLELHNTSITGNTSGAGYAVYMADAQYDGHSYFTSRNKISGNVIINNNEGGNLYMGKDVVIVITADGLGQDTSIDVTLDSGVVTNRVFGSYNYEGGNLQYLITAGERSITDPEVVVTEPEQPDATEENTEATDTPEGQGEDNTMLYVAIGGIAAVIVLAAVAVVIGKKKKANKAESK